MRAFALVVVVFAVSVTGFANPNPSAPLAPNPKRPNYAELKRLSSGEIHQELAVFVGQKDSWSDSKQLLKKLRAVIPFKKAPATLQEEIRELSYIHARKSPTALQEYILKVRSSSNPAVQSLVGTVVGDKRLAYEQFLLDPGTDKNLNMLFFFKNLQYGDTGLEWRKFHNFSLAFEYLAYNLKQSLVAAQSANMPLVLEFESSAFLKESPLVRMFYDLLTNDPSRLTRIQATPDGGRIVSLFPARAERVVDNLTLFAEQFKKTIRLLQSRYFEGPEVKSRLVELVRTGEGISGLFYIDEKIVEIALNKSHSAKSCAALFSTK